MGAPKTDSPPDATVGPRFTWNHTLSAKLLLQQSPIAGDSGEILCQPNLNPRVVIRVKKHETAKWRSGNFVHAVFGSHENSIRGNTGHGHLIDPQFLLLERIDVVSTGELQPHPLVRWKLQNLPQQDIVFRAEHSIRARRGKLPPVVLPVRDSQRLAISAEQLLRDGLRWRRRGLLTATQQYG